MPPRALPASRAGNSRSAVRKRPRRSSSATVAGARALALRRRSPDFGGERLSATFRPWALSTPCGTSTSGVIAGALLDAAAAEVAPVGREVLADGDVQRAAVGERLLLLEDALAEGVRADDRRAVVVLQGGRDDLRAEAVLRSTSTTTGSRRRSRRRSRISVCVGWVRPRVRDDRALGNEDARDELCLLDQAAAVVAQVEHDPLRAGVQLVFDSLAHFGVRARTESGERHDAELDPVDGLRSRGDDRL